MRKLVLAFVILFSLGTVILCSCKKTKTTDEPPINTQSGYQMFEQGDIENLTELPNYVNIMFQVTDMEGNGVANLTKEDFGVLEDEKTVSPSESFMQIRKQQLVPYHMKTVLVLDNSNSIGDNLGQIINAAKALVYQKLPNQEIAVFTFSEDPVLVIDFTTNTSELVSALESITKGAATTDLYGAIIAGVNHWEDYYHIDEIQQGFMVLFTDGSDTQDEFTFNEAMSARGDKQVYAVGLGSEIEPDVMKQVGNADFVSIDDVTELEQKFIDIQNEMAGYANSFYWLNYMSPKRGDKDHTLKLFIKDNAYTGSNSFIEGNFNSKDFYSEMEGVYVNSTPENISGINEIEISENDTIQLNATTYLGENSPSYIWEAIDESVVKIELDAFDNSIVNVIALADSGSVTTIEVTDVENSQMGANNRKIISVKITKNAVPIDGLVSYFSFENGNVNDVWGSYTALNYGAEIVNGYNNAQNSALKFDGISNLVETNDEILKTGDKTISFWMNAAQSDKNQVLLTNSYGPAPQDKGFIIEIMENNALSFKLGNGNAEAYFMTINSSYTVSLNQWIHVVMVYDGSNLKAYADGILIGNTNMTIGDESMPQNACRFADDYNPLNSFFNGSMDNIRFYNRALNMDEINLLLNE
ncbi:MAG: VWA domain-containing protein [Bacteroidales bacterium]|nr:VWA domain-containing protein [Bacteroidales bacterium]